MNPLIESLKTFGLFFATWIGAFIMFTFFVCLSEFLKDLKEMASKKWRLVKRDF